MNDTLSRRDARRRLEEMAPPAPGPLTGVKSTMTGAELRAWRQAKNFTQMEAAAWLNERLSTKYTSQQVSNWENAVVIRGKVRGVPGRVAVAVLAGK